MELKARFYCFALNIDVCFLDAILTAFGTKVCMKIRSCLPVKNEKRNSRDVKKKIENRVCIYNINLSRCPLLTLQWLTKAPTEKSCVCLLSFGRIDRNRAPRIASLLSLTVLELMVELDHVPTGLSCFQTPSSYYMRELPEDFHWVMSGQVLYRVWDRNEEGEIHLFGFDTVFSLLINSCIFCCSKNKDKIRFKVDLMVIYILKTWLHFLVFVLRKRKKILKN